MKKTKSDGFTTPVKRNGKVVGYAAGKANAKNIERIFKEKDAKKKK